MSGEADLRALSIDELRNELRARQKHKSTNLPSEKFRSLQGLENVETPTVVRELKDKQRAIYGTDNRTDLFVVNDPLILASADGVVAICEKGDIVDNGDGTSTLRTVRFGEARGLCDSCTSDKLCTSEPFSDQPLGCFCSGFLIAPDIVATAGHCIDDPSNESTSLNNVRFVFGFRMKNASTPQTVISNNEIFSGKTTIGRRRANNGSDWAIVQLDRPVTNHRSLPIRFSRVADNQDLYVIGHPVGLPTKFADGAKVRDNSPGSFFTANLDTYGGNSGSPVFNRNTHVVEGILVRGENDFVDNVDCIVSLTCPDTGCRGEDCTRISEFQMLVGFPTLPIPATLRRESRGDGVKFLQVILKTKGFDAGQVDGIFGSKTEAAVKGFQSSKELVVDGIVGPKTWNGLLA
jgi:Trypsin-like peptidase domain/Putative peptidoglycan binding domain